MFSTPPTGNDPDGHQAILSRYAYNLAGAAGHASFIAELYHSGVSITTEDTQVSSSWDHATKMAPLRVLIFVRVIPRVIETRFAG